MVARIEKLAHVGRAELQRRQCGSLREIVRELRRIKRLDLADRLETEHVFIAYVDKLLSVEGVSRRRNDRHDTDHFALLILAVVFRNPAVRIKRNVSYYECVVSDCRLARTELVNSRKIVYDRLFRRLDRRDVLDSVVGIVNFVERTSRAQNPAGLDIPLEARYLLESGVVVRKPREIKTATLVQHFARCRICIALGLVIRSTVIVSPCRTARELHGLVRFALVCKAHDVTIRTGHRR